MEDFEWTYDITPPPLDGVKFKTPNGDMYTIRDRGISNDTCDVTWMDYSTKSLHVIIYEREDINKFIDDLTWKIVE